jgi:hypothetical protein
MEGVRKMVSKRYRESIKRLVAACKKKGINKDVYVILTILAGCQQTYEHTGWDTAQAIDYMTSLVEKHDDEVELLTEATAITGFEDDPDDEPFDPVKFLED